MRKSELQIKIRTSKGKAVLDFNPVKIADGVIATSTLVDNSPLILIDSKTILRSQG